MGYTKRVNRSKGKGRSRSRARSRRGGMFKAINNSLKSMVDGMDWRENPLSQAEKGRSLSPPNFPPSVNTTPLTVSKGSKKGDEMVGGKRRKTRRGRKSKKHYKKGSASKTRKGRKDFVTHKGDKKYHRRGHRQSKPQKRKSMLAKLLGL